MDSGSDCFGVELVGVYSVSCFAYATEVLEDGASSFLSL